MGLTAGLLLTALGTRMLFVPSTLYSQVLGHKMKLLAPDMDELNANYKKFAKRGDRPASNIERAKIKNLRRQHGVYPMLSMLNLFQLPIV